MPRTAVLGFTANDAFDVGTDSYSPVSLAYFDRAPFMFNGNIDKVKINYLEASALSKRGTIQNDGPHF